MRSPLPKSPKFFDTQAYTLQPWLAGGLEVLTKTSSLLVQTSSQLAKQLTQALRPTSTKTLVNSPKIGHNLFQHLTRKIEASVAESKQEKDHLKQIRRDFAAQQGNKSNPVTPKTLSEFLNLAFACPEIIRPPALQTCAKMAIFLNSWGEMFSDASGLIDKCVRNSISTGEKSDIAWAIGGMCGRMSTSYLNVGTSINKMIGLLCFIGANIASALVIVTMGINFAQCKWRKVKFEPFKKNAKLDKKYTPEKAPYQFIIDFIKKKREAIAEKKDITYLTAHKSKYGENDNEQTRYNHTHFMWKNLHNGKYSLCTRVLMTTAHFLVALNRLTMSSDKHLAHRFNVYGLGQVLGAVMGQRLANLFCAVGAVAFSIATSNILPVGISFLFGALCGVAVLLMLAAKGSAWIDYNLIEWKHAPNKFVGIVAAC